MPKTWIIGLALTTALLAAAQQTSGPEALLGQGVHHEEAEGDLEGAIATYQKFLAEYGSNRALAAQAQFRLGQAYEKLGRTEARRAYEQVVNNYSDQTDYVNQAKARLSALSAEATNGKMVVRSLAEADYFVMSASHDGRYAAIRRSSGYYIYDLATHTERPIVQSRRSTVEMGRPIISHDNSLFAYTLEDPVDGDRSRVHYRLRVIGMNGQGDRLLWDDTGTYQHVDLVDWTRDDSRILLLARDTDEVCQLLLFDASNGSPKVIHRYSACTYLRDNVALFSPDDRHVIFSQRTDKEAPRDILSMPVAGGTPSPLISHAADDSPVGWTGDGRLVFWSDRATTDGIWAVPVRDGKAAGQAVALKRDFGNAPSDSRVISTGPVQFSSNGSFFFSVRTRPRDLYIATLGTGPGGLASDLTLVSDRFEGVNAFPAFSPDGRVLAYITGPDNDTTIQFRTLETGEERTLPQPAALEAIYDMRWFPDGRELLLSGRQPDSTLVLFRMNTETGEGSVVLDENLTSNAATNPSLDPEAEWLYFLTRLEGDTENRIVRHHLASGKLETVVEPGGSGLRLYALSPDGQQLATVNGSGNVLQVRPVAGGAARTVYTYGDGEWMRGWGSLEFTADGSAVLHSQVVGDGFYDDALLLTPLDGGPTRRLADTKMLYRVRPHPDGRRIVVMTHHFHSELWVAENLDSTEVAAR